MSFTRGRIIEEDQSYPFGLKIAGISSAKLGDNLYEGYLKNNNLYNDKELFDDGDLNWYDYGFRNYDAQIGRFPQLDPLTDGYPHYTPFQYAGNEPIANIDIKGLEPGSSITVSVIGEAAASGTYIVLVKSAPPVTQAAAKTASGSGSLISSFISASLSLTKSVISD